MKQTTFALKLAGAAALAGSTQAYGQIFQYGSHSLPQNLPLPATPDVNNSYSNSESWNAQSGQSTNGVLLPTADFDFSTFYNGNNTYFVTSAYGIKAGTGTAGAYVTNTRFGYTYFYASALSKGTKVGSDTSLNFKQSVYPNYGAFLAVSLGGVPNNYAIQQPDVPQYLGFQFLDSSNVLHNGWLEVESVQGSTGGLYFLGGAYNTLAADAPNGAGDIYVGLVPEPGTLSSLVLGAAALAGVGLARRRRAVALAR